MAEVPAAVWSGAMSLMGVVLHLHVLDDGTRIIEAQDVEALLAAMESGAAPVDEEEMAAFARWQRGVDA